MSTYLSKRHEVEILDNSRTHKVTKTSNRTLQTELATQSYPPLYAKLVLHYVRKKHLP